MFLDLVVVARCTCDGAIKPSEDSALTEYILGIQSQCYFDLGNGHLTNSLRLYLGKVARKATVPSTEDTSTNRIKNTV